MSKNNDQDQALKCGLKESTVLIFDKRPNIVYCKSTMHVRTAEVMIYSRRE